MRWFLLAGAFLTVSVSTSVGVQAEEFAWAKQLGGTLQDYANSLALDASGNVYIVGSFRGTADFDPGPGSFDLISTGSTDAFISKLDSEGTLVWARKLGGTSSDAVYAYKVALDTTSNVYTVGFFEGSVDFDPGPGTFTLTAEGSRDAFLSKLDDAGDFVWVKQFGGPSDEYSYGVALDTQGNVYSVGWFYSTTDFDPGSGTFDLTPSGGADAFVSKLDSAGNLLWSKQLGGTSVDEAYDVAVDVNGNVYTVGIFRGSADFDPGSGTFDLISAGGSDVFILKLDSNGSFIWAGRTGATEFEYLGAVSLDPSGNIYVVGAFGGAADFDPGPGTFNLTSAGDIDPFVWKLTSTGSLVWAKQFSGALQGDALDIAADASGNTYVVGYIEGTTDFDPSPGIFNLATAGYRDGFIAKLDSGGNLVRANGIAGALEDLALGVALNSIGDVYTVGVFSGTADFDPGSDVFNLTEAGGTDAFVLKLANSVSCQPMPADIVSWWRGDGNASDGVALDVIGTNHGSLVNGAMTGPGIAGTSFVFDGTNDYVNIPHSPSLFFNDQEAFTVEGWFKAESETPSYFILKNAAYGIRWQGTNSPLLYYNGNNHYSTRTTWELDRWYHVALVDDGTNSVKLYVDGALDESDDGPLRNPNRFPCISYCFPLQFGAWYEPDACGGDGRCNVFFNGEVDEVTIHDRALTQSEIQSIFAAAGAGKCWDEDDDQFPLPYDCDDADPAVNPLAAEGCNGIDDDCDTAVDEGLGSTTCGVGACQRTVQNCSEGQPQTCEPGAPSTEICDAIDNDCTGVADDGDQDGDSFIVCADCNDSNPSIHPGAAEVCNSIDDDCDAVIDEDAQGVDSDGDSVRNTCDNCRFQFNPSQADTDGDHIGNSCDNCLLAMNPLQEDLDGDLRGNVCDNCPSEYNTLQDDSDGDRVGDVCDNCVLQSNTAQTDLDHDLQGDVCDENDGLIYVLLTGPTSITYQLEAGFSRFNVYRGSLSVLASLGIYTQSTLDSPYAAQFCARASGGLDDAFSPGPGQIVHYLVTGVGVIEGSLGTNSAGLQRPNDNPCP